MSTAPDKLHIVNNVRSDTTIDVRNCISPVSLLKVENQLGEMTSGQILEVLCADTETKTDLIAIMRNSTHRCIAVEKRPDHFRLLIERRDD